LFELKKTFRRSVIENGNAHKTRTDGNMNKTFKKKPFLFQMSTSTEHFGTLFERNKSKPID